MKIGDANRRTSLVVLCRGGSRHVGRGRGAVFNFYIGLLGFT